MLCFPGEHALHLDGASIPVAIENMPGVHGIHEARLAAPVASLHIPAGQATHLVLSKLECVPGKHAAQAVSPFDETLPLEQALQAFRSLFGRLPALHCRQLALPGALATLPDSQGTQPEEFTAPNFGSARPGAQGTHSSLLRCQ